LRQVPRLCKSVVLRLVPLSCPPAPQLRIDGLPYLHRLPLIEVLCTARPRRCALPANCHRAACLQALPGSGEDAGCHSQTVDTKQGSKPSSTVCAGCWQRPELPIELMHTVPTCCARCPQAVNPSCSQLSQLMPAPAATCECATLPCVLQHLPFLHLSACSPAVKWCGY
jgi:hypothetical protein